MKNVGITKEIDALVRLQIPKDIRERLELTGEVELIVTPDGLLVRSNEYRLVRRDTDESKTTVG